MSDPIMVQNRGVYILSHNHTAVYEKREEGEGDNKKEVKVFKGYERTGLNRGARLAVATYGSARDNKVKTVVIMALLAFAGIAIAKAAGQGTAFDTLKKLVLDHKIESAIIAGGLGLGVLGYAHGRREEGAKLWTEFKDSIAELRAMLPSMPSFRKKLAIEDEPKQEPPKSDDEKG